MEERHANPFVNVHAMATAFAVFPWDADVRLSITHNNSFKLHSCNKMHQAQMFSYIVEF